LLSISLQSVIVDDVEPQPLFATIAHHKLLLTSAIAKFSVASLSVISSFTIELIVPIFDTSVPLYAFCSFSRNVFLSEDEPLKLFKSHENTTNLLGFTISPVIIESLKSVVQL
jgi:hypothetical protein